MGMTCSSAELPEKIRTQLYAAHLSSLVEAKREIETTEYRRLCSEGLQLMYGDTVESLEKAEEKLHAAALRCPQRRDGHGIRAQVLSRLKRKDEAFTCYLRVLELSIAHDKLWAKAVTSVFEHLQFGEIGSPTAVELGISWWNDEALKNLSAEVESIIGDDWIAVNFRAIVLYGSCYPWARWDAGDRSAEELRGAADRFQQVAKLHIQLAASLPNGEQARAVAKQYISLGVTARQRADLADKHEVKGQ